MKKIQLLLLCIVLSAPFCLNAQTATADTTTFDNLADQFSLGIGMGQNFGGFGGNLLFYPQENIGFFGGAGYALAGMGYNLGIKARFLPKKKAGTNFYLLGMYGYNAAVKVENGDQYNKLFYGPSLGFGIDTGKRKYRSGYWTLAIIIPFRAAEVDDYLDELEDDHGVTFEQKFFPIAFSVGYRFSLD